MGSKKDQIRDQKSLSSVMPQKHKIFSSSLHSSSLLQEWADGFSAEDQEIREQTGFTWVRCIQKSPILWACTEELYSLIKLKKRQSLFYALKQCPLSFFTEISLYPLLIKGFKSDSPKVRQSVAQFLSYYQNQEFEEEIWQNLQKEPIHWVRVSLILALGSLQTPSAQNKLLKYQPQGKKEAHALKQIQNTLHQHFSFLFGEHSYFKVTTGGASFLSTVLNSSSFESTSPPSSSPFLESVLHSPFFFQTAHSETRFQSLFPLPRFARALISPLDQQKAQAHLSSHHRIQNVLQHWISQNQLSPLQCSFPSLNSSFSSSLSSSPSIQNIPLQYRIHLPSKLKDKTKKKILHQIRTHLKTLCPLWQESPKAYHLNLCFELGLKSDLFYIDWTSCTQSQFQRPFDVGASIAGETAYLIALLAHKFTQKAYSRLSTSSSQPYSYTCLDPTCGSGTLLFERARLMASPTSLEQMPNLKYTLQGMDCSPTAHQACIKNQHHYLQNYTGSKDETEYTLLEHMTFIRGDSQEEQTWQPFDQAIMNLPFGLRVDPQSSISALTKPCSLDDLYLNLLTQACKWIKPQGHLIVYSTHFKKLQFLIDSLKLRILAFYRLKSGGLEVGVWVLIKSNSSG